MKTLTQQESDRIFKHISLIPDYIKNNVAKFTVPEGKKLFLIMLSVNIDPYLEKMEGAAINIVQKCKYAVHCIMDSDTNELYYKNDLQDRLNNHLAELQLNNKLNFRFLQFINR